MEKYRKDCPKCNGKGWYFVDEWFFNLQGRRDCKCKKLIYIKSKKNDSTPTY